MTDKMTPSEALQKILDALGVDDLNLNSRGLFEYRVTTKKKGA